jgi:hypothetical protein
MWRKPRARERSSSPDEEVSRSGAMPEPTVQRGSGVLAPRFIVKVRMKEDVPMRFGRAVPDF